MKLGPGMYHLNTFHLLKMRVEIKRQQGGIYKKLFKNAMELTKFSFNMT